MTRGRGEEIKLGADTPERTRYVAVIGPGEEASTESVADAAAVARLIAQRGWIMLCGGRAAGVMAAAAHAAREAGGITVGVLPGNDRRDAAPGLTVALSTGLGEARNAVLVSSADAVIACGMNAGTASELALALRARKPTALLGARAEDATFFTVLARGAALLSADSPTQAIEWLAAQLTSDRAPAGH